MNLNLFLNDLFFFLPELFFAIFISVFLIFGVIFTNSKNKINKLYYVLNNSFLNLILYFLIILFILTYNNITKSFTIFNGFFTQNLFIITIKFVILIFFIFFIFTIKQYLNNLKNYDYEFILMILFSVFSMFLILNSNDFLTLYLCVELQSLGFYVLVSSKQTSSFSTEGGLKYFILGSFSSGLFLFGISLVYGFCGMLNFDDISSFTYSLISYNNDSNIFFFIQNGFILGILFITVALLFKLGSAPFHMWVPDVYEGAPMIITAFLSILPKIIMMFIFTKLYLSVFHIYLHVWHFIFIVVSIISIIWGSVAAIYQIKIKRLFTYSMIANSGFFLLGLAFVNLEGLQSIWLYLFIYMFIMLGIFISIITLKEYNNNFIIKKISLFINLYNINPVLAVTITILLFSIAGIPPLVGFYGKFYLFFISLKNNMYIVTLIFVLFSIVSIFYYIRLIKLMFFNKNKFWFFFYPITRANSYILGFITIINLLFFINPNLIFKFIYNISLSFYL